MLIQDDNSRYYCQVCIKKSHLPGSPLPIVRYAKILQNKKKPETSKIDIVLEIFTRYKVKFSTKK